MSKLTARQVALLSLEEPQSSPWDAEARQLKRDGLIEEVMTLHLMQGGFKTIWRITEAGRAALREAGHE